jgi:non-haem Fe2+, alpha-ketoglutarate-dependent halogenase
MCPTERSSPSGRDNVIARGGEVFGAELIASFRRDGCLFPVEVLSPVEVLEYHDALTRHLVLCARVGGLVGVASHGPKIHLLWPWADRLVRHPRLLRLAQDILGPDVLIWNTSIFVKEPGGTADIALHQDAVSYDLERCEGRAFRVWLALTPTTVENGTMRFAVGSHRGGVLPHRRARDDSGQARGDEVASEVPATDIRDVLLRAGQCSVHDPLVVHGSGLNRTDTPRVTFAVDYLATCVRPRGDADSALLVSGQDRYGYFQLETPIGPQPNVQTLRQFRQSVAKRMTRLGSVADENLASGLLRRDDPSDCR